jgi:hypothetical protein
MEKPETLATFDTQDTRLRQTKRITQNRKLETAYPTRAHGVFSGFMWGRASHLFSFLFCVIRFVCLSLVSCVSNVASVSGFSILDCPFGFSNVYNK